ncbi:MAG TPA: glycosyltransferase family 4 protein, partial [Planctomycetota bacterium]|nr:glycosyltransferase family 4 protein [Planctomycetota bacterium]
LERREATRLLLVAAAAGRFTSVADPLSGSLAGRWLAGACDRIPGLGWLLTRKAPRAFTSMVERLVRMRRYDLVLVRGSRLRDLGARLAELAPCVYDASRADGNLRAACRRLGREDVLGSTVDPKGGLGSSGDAFRAILAPSALDAERLRATGTTAPVHVVPPIAALDDLELSIESPILGRREPVRPRRILAVGSERIDNLDGLRWFRRRVLPMIFDAVPSARFRIVGESGRHLEPGPDVERLGHVENLAREYREAALVVLPLRLDGGLRRRAVEALAHGRVLAATSEGAAGLEIAPGRDGVIASDEEELARGIIRVLTDDSYRRAMERRSFEIARSRFKPSIALAPILDLLGLETELPTTELEETAEVATTSA